jgi:hypothetical protein
MQYNTGQLSSTGPGLDVPSDPFMLLVAPVERFDSSSGFSTANFCNNKKAVSDFNNFVAIVIAKDLTNQVFLDGHRLTSWSTYWGTYAIATAAVTNGAHVITTWPSAEFGAYCYGHALSDQSASAYGYTAAFKVGGSLVGSNWEASARVLEVLQAATLMTNCAQENVYSGSLVSSYTVLASSYVLSYPIDLEVRPVAVQSVTSLSATCLTMYKNAFIQQLINVTRTVNYLICSGNLCPDVDGLPGGGANIDSSSQGNIVGAKNLFVAVDASYNTIASSVSFGLNSQTGLVTAILFTVPYVGVLDTYSAEFGKCRTEVRDYVLQFENWPLGGGLVPDLSTSGCGKMTFGGSEFVLRKANCPATT